MPPLPVTPPFLGSVPYLLASEECQLQAQQLTQLLLGERFPALTNMDWHYLLTKYRPLLWIDETAQTVTVADEVLPDLVNRVTEFEATKQHAPLPLLIKEEVYLAKQLDYYCRMADRLVKIDPELTHPDSITDMRNVFFRLSGGNAVAERLSELPTPPSNDGVEMLV